MFKDSCVTQLSPWRAGEEATSLPERIFPAYAGSGICAVGLDASGLQGLNHRVQAAYGSAERAGDLYIIHHGMIGDQLFEDCALPLGYMDWEMELDGDLITSANLAEKAVLWERELLLDEAKVVTTMMFHNRLRLRIAVWVPYGTKSPVVEVELQGRRYMAKPLERDLAVSFRLRVTPQTRQGAPLYASFAAGDDALALEFQGSRDHYRVEYTLDNDLGLRPQFAAGRFGIEWKTSVGHDAQTLRAVVGLGERTPASELEAVRERHRASWSSYFASMAEVSGISDKEAYLLHHSYYLIRMGMDFSKGITIGTPFYQPWCWKASVFWDSHFVSDGLLRAGDRADVDTFLDFLHRTMKPEGKPFPWMMQHDGHSTIPEERDFAPLVISAHAMTAIKVFEYGRDLAQLERVVFPILARISAFAADNMFREEEDGRWIVAMPVSNDVVEDVAVEINQTYTCAWFLSVFKKTIEYAELLGTGEEIAARLRPIVDGYHLEHEDGMYLHARNMPIDEQHYASWTPFLLYPTEASPFVDLERLRRTRERFNFPDLYMEKQGDFQPWGNFMQSSSDLRLGEVEKAHATFAQGLNYTFGPGLFSEVGPRQETVALPPYITAHGNYISNLLSFFVTDSLWGGQVGVFARLPEAYRGLSLKVKGIHAFGGACVAEAEYGPVRVTAKLGGLGTGAAVELPVPVDVPAEAVAVRVNGADASFERAFGGRTIIVRVDGLAKHYDIEVSA
ncbi:glycosyl hydrolase family 95 catalytic domain-containing protein [Paenibacillus sacheonensis]|uniref:Uncharacterized protein n=1 Tax=Paenibacillus sacheonensis TaxID=742054 RepID=A0A7X5BUI8_9BACL|nr:hypothetical protein [Paenibacillus sacheonensis]MBM7564279.1 hypothetical protein [Paenibacillus sacheonensis]NBC67398.1 hypothetical protein [Paenibacillus sacheonensis]